LWLRIFPIIFISLIAHPNHVENINLESEHTYRERNGKIYVLDDLVLKDLDEYFNEYYKNQL